MFQRSYTMKKILSNPTFSEALRQMPLAKRLFFSVFGTFVLGFLFLSLLSYNVLDPAWSHVGERQEVSNVGGRVGAWLADILHVFFGVGAWWLVIAMVYELALLWWRKSQMLWQLRVLSYGFILICISGILSGWQWSEGLDAALTSGGVMGVELYQGLFSLFGAVPTMLFLVAISAVVMMLVFEISWAGLWGGLLGILGLKKSTNITDMPSKPVPAQVHQDLQDNHFDTVISTPSEPLLTNDTANHIQIHADEVVLKAENITLNTTQINADTTPPHDEDATTKFDLMADDELIEILNHDSDDIDQDNHVIDTPALSTHDSQNVVDDVNDKHGIEADFVYQNKQTNQTQSISQSEVFDMHWNVLDTDTQKSDTVSIDELATSTSSNLSDDTTEQIITPAKPDIFDEPNPSRSYAMDTLSHRMSLTPIPELSILDKPDINKPSYTKQELQMLSELLEIKLREFNIKANVISAMVGPVVTRFEVELAAGIKASRVTGASQDLARSLSMASLRVVEVIPGKPYIGIEVPNKQREMVRLIELLDTPDYKNPDKQIGVAIGKDIGGKVVIADLAKAPHMLVAGTTGSGKSVFVNSILLSMLFKYTPDELKLVLIDPKQLELANYGDIPHLLTPVITDMTEATAALTWCVNEMERRYQLMSLLRVRKISEFNKKVINAEKLGEPIFDPLWRADENVSIKTAPKLKPLPLIVIVADEFADMIMQLGKTAEEPIVRLAQKARAAGIHLVLATQRPTVNVVTGLIKANIPSRVALRVNSKVDSRTIIEEGGAENMLGNGDMMFIGPSENTPRRVHGAYVDDNEVNRVCDAWRERGSPDYIDLSSSYTFEGEGTGDGLGKGGDDEYYHQAVTFVMESRRVSISSIQRKLGIGYNRAARIVDMMEEAGLVSPMDNAGKRQILM